MMSKFFSTQKTTCKALSCMLLLPLLVGMPCVRASEGVSDEPFYCILLPPNVMERVRFESRPPTHQGPKEFFLNDEGLIMDCTLKLTDVMSKLEGGTFLTHPSRKVHCCLFIEFKDIGSEDAKTLKQNIEEQYINFSQRSCIDHRTIQTQILNSIFRNYMRY